MLRRFVLLGLVAAAACAPAAAAAQTPAAAATPRPKEEKRDSKAARNVELTAEQVAEAVIIAHGSRPVLEQVRRTGVERGRVSRTGSDGAPVEITYERFFKRGETSDKDKIRVDQKRASLEYSLIYTDGRLRGLIKGTSFTPRQEEAADFDASRLHGIEALLRYKENGSAIKYVGKEKQKNIDMWVLELRDKQDRATRYYVSSQTGKVLWLEYEDAARTGTGTVKYRRTFHDYRVVQGTRVPYRSVLYAGDSKVEESEVLTVTYGVKMEDSMFRNEQAADNDGF